LTAVEPRSSEVEHQFRYLGDIGVPPVDAPTDLDGRGEVHLGGAWHGFDPRSVAVSPVPSLQVLISSRRGAKQ